MAARGQSLLEEPRALLRPGLLGSELRGGLQEALHAWRWAIFPPGMSRARGGPQRTPLRSTRIARSRSASDARSVSGAGSHSATDPPHAHASPPARISSGPAPVTVPCLARSEE